MLNPQFVAGEHGLFGGHGSEDIRTFLKTISLDHLIVDQEWSLISQEFVGFFYEELRIQI